LGEQETDDVHDKGSPATTRPALSDITMINRILARVIPTNSLRRAMVSSASKSGDELACKGNPVIVDEAVERGQFRARGWRRP
jgi:hypothetical protein